MSCLLNSNYAVIGFLNDAVLKNIENKYPVNFIEAFKSRNNFSITHINYK